ncbi:hypothetical protein [Myroides]|uniref:Trypsin-like peptidase n=1 Tax=Myroides indicus TaxID=1323422 RepID=A0A4R7FB84_9FLAO|nr:hypothetical protein [Myroides]APA93461.1 hypothetical protein BK054_14745 [Myroides sp. ZB35]MDM1035329.1 hypothetical protein [Myroides odoratimimus]MDM1462027.1 hypothetical protein [Myroides odoratimimus]TDS64392.1 hypothetical protein C8P70_104110 [Myroides indicus]
MKNITFKNIAQKQVESIPRIRSYTCPLLKNKTNYKQHGTGVFVKIESKYFLFTAAHVLDDIEDIFIPLKNGFDLLKPGGEIIKNEATDNRATDELDLGILILDELSVKDILNDFIFLECSDIELSHTPSHFLNYLIFGYPTSWSKKSMTRNSFHTRSFIHQTNCIKTEDYTQYNRKEFLNLIVEYDRQNTLNLKSNNLSFGPNLFGISGCGLWYINPNDLNSSPKLVAIMNEWSISNRSKLFATRIDAFTEILRKNNIIKYKESSLFGFT